MGLNVVDGDNYDRPDTIEPDCDWPIIANCHPSRPLEPEIVELANEAAAEIMNAATARRFGVCTSTFAPLPPPPAETGHVSGWSLVDPKISPSIYGSDRFRQWENQPTPALCTEDDGTRLRLWHTRVIDVVQVEIAGSVVDPATYYLDGNILVRDDGSAWPTRQEGRRHSSTAWEVTYRHGIPVSNAGAVATGVLACEIALALSGDDRCELPSRTKTYTNHAGLTIGFIDPMEFLEDGLTGLYVPDQWIRRMNPHGIVRRARAYSFKKQRRQARRLTNPEMS